MSQKKNKAKKAKNYREPYIRQHEREYIDIFDDIEGLIEYPKTVEEREHNTYLKLLYEYKLAYDRREHCVKFGIFYILITAAVSLGLMLGFDSKAFFLSLWIFLIIAGIAVLVSIDYRCYKYEHILGLDHTQKEDDLEKIRSDIKQKISSLDLAEFKSRLKSITADIFPQSDKDNENDKGEKL